MNGRTTTKRQAWRITAASRASRIPQSAGMEPVVATARDGNLPGAIPVAGDQDPLHWSPGSPSAQRSATLSRTRRFNHRSSRSLVVARSVDQVDHPRPRRANFARSRPARSEYEGGLPISK